MTTRTHRRASCLLPAALVCALAVQATAVEPPPEPKPFSPEQIEFFETKIRPLLARECYDCHSAQAKTLKGSLRVDSREALLHGGDSGQAVVPGKPDASNLIQAIRWQTSEMPPTGKLKPDEIAALEKWIEIGVPWPSETTTAAKNEGRKYDFAALRKSHWAWQPVVEPTPPAVKNTAWPINDVDRFVLAKLTAAGLEPNPPAEPAVLLRRLYLDLLGLPPPPEEVDRFVRDYDADREAAVARVVEFLLESPHYGERWGRHWLDVARYSDGYGSFLDRPGLPNAWRYRDWVVAALNRDLPYDEFVRLQIAGDVIDPKQAVATGFLALGPTYISDGGDAEATAQAKSETLDDRVDTVMRGFMAVTVACARCHDHRFDPFPQIDYYSIAGVFNNTRAENIPLASPEQVVAYKKYHEELKKLDSKERKLRSIVRTENRDLTDEEKRQATEIKAEIAKLKQNAPPDYPAVHCVTEAGSADMNVAIRGNLLRPGEIAPRRFLGIVAGSNASPFTHGSGRWDLAEAIADPANPLTARVIVNRVWQQHFGQGLVRTPSNFGTLGEQPSHPELLDWLASRLVERTGDKGQGPRWSLKALHRLIVTSATYQMDSSRSERSFAADGDNRLLWRMNPRRLDVEAWRDVLLSVTGELDAQLGGASIDDIERSRRRTMYASISRNGDKFPSDLFLRTFDFPAARSTSEGRTSSVVPQQSLFMMNSPFMLERAKAFAARLHREATDDAARIERAYLLLYSRAPTPDELALGAAFVKTTPGLNDVLSPWQQYAHVLLSASEVMYWE